MHRSTARDHKDVIYAQVRDEARHIIRKFYHHASIIVSPNAARASGTLLNRIEGSRWPVHFGDWHHVGDMDLGRVIDQAPFRVDDRHHAGAPGKPCTNLIGRHARPG